MLYLFAYLASIPPTMLFILEHGTNKSSDLMVLHESKCSLFGSVFLTGLGISSL